MENINTAKKEYNEIYTSPMKNLSYTIFLPISNIQPSVNFVRYRLSNHEKSCLEINRILKIRQTSSQAQTGHESFPRKNEEFLRQTNTKRITLL